MSQICALMDKVVLSSFSSVLLFFSFLSNVSHWFEPVWNMCYCYWRGGQFFLFPHFMFLLCVSVCHGKQGPMKSVFSWLKEAHTLRFYQRYCDVVMYCYSLNVILNRVYVLWIDLWERCLSTSKSLQETLFGCHPAEFFWTFEDFWFQKYFLGPQ